MGNNLPDPDDASLLLEQQGFTATCQQADAN
jgi:hypothetical protein